MKLPRISIGFVMWVVLIASVNLAGVRALERGFFLPLRIFILVIMPMASILMVGVPALVKGLLKRERVNRFLVAFEAVGWIVLPIYASLIFLNPEKVELGIHAVMRWLGFPDGAITFGPSLKLLAVFLLILLPQLLVTIVGAWIFTFKISVSIKLRERSEPGPSAV